MAHRRSNWWKALAASRAKGNKASRSMRAKILARQNYYHDRVGRDVPITLPQLYFMRDNPEATPMCDYSLMHVKSRAANVGDKLVVHNFGTGTRGFASPDDLTTAVCVLPGTEIAFEKPIEVIGSIYVGTGVVTKEHKTARFRQTDQDLPLYHHDCLELPDGEQVKLTNLFEGQRATVLQLPAAPKTEAEAAEQKRVEVVA